MKKVIFVCIVSLAVCFVAGKAAVPDKSTATVQPGTPPPAPAEHDKNPLTTSPKPTASSSTAPTVPTSQGTPTSKPNDNKAITTTPVPTAQTTQKPDNITTEAVVTDKTTSSTTTTTTTLAPPPAPVVTPKPAVPEPKLARGFDGASFTGGIILTLGLLALGFMGFKYYKNQTERNYHTL